MIEINLLPGAKRARKTKGGSAVNLAAASAWISNKVKDKWLAAAIGTGFVALLGIGFLFFTQRKRETDLLTAQAKAVEDSTRFARHIQARARAQARRDSALLQLRIIRAIDDDRYIWPHVMEEVSRALPAYTWLRDFAITGTAQGLTPAASVRTPPIDTSRTQKARKDPPLPVDTIRMTLVGQTVDVQAYTRFLRSLEDSPFIEGVTIQNVEPRTEGGKEVHQFTFGLTYSRPDTLLLNRVPLLPRR